MCVCVCVVRASDMVVEAKLFRRIDEEFPTKCAATFRTSRTFFAVFLWRIVIQTFNRRLHEFCRTPYISIRPIANSLCWHVTRIQHSNIDFCTHSNAALLLARVPSARLRDRFQNRERYLLMRFCVRWFVCVGARVTYIILCTAYACQLLCSDLCAVRK